MPELENKGCGCSTNDTCHSNTGRGRELRGRARALSYFTVAYNVVEGAVSIAIGSLAGSIALVGFGLDSFMESLSGGVLIWRFSHRENLSEEEEERIERKAVRLIGYAFFLFGAYVLYESVAKLVMKEEPEASVFGMAIAVISLVVMAFLYYMKVKTGRELGSRSLVADSRQTLACMFLSVALLLGLGLNYLFGLWWADPVAGLVVVIFLLREGLDALREGRLCAC